MMRAQEFERHSGMSPQMGLSSNHQFAPQGPMAAPHMAAPHSHMVPAHGHMFPSHAHYGPPPHDMAPHMAPMPPQQPAGTHYGDGSVGAYHEPHQHMPEPPFQSMPAYHYPTGGQGIPPMVPPNGPDNETDDAPMDEAPVTVDPPDDEPPSLSKRPGTEPSTTYSSGEPIATFSSDPQSASNLVYSDTDNQGESYEETEFSPAPTQTESDSRDYYADGTVGGHYYSTSQSESALSPGGPYESGQHPAYQFDQPVHPQQHEGSYDPSEHPQAPYRFDDSVDEYPEGYDRQNESWEQYGEQNEMSGYQTEQLRYPDYSEQQESYREDFDESTRDRPDLPPVSPQSQTGSEHISHTSSAMRGAQELLKRNRQKRLELAARRSDGAGLRSANNTLQVSTRQANLGGQKQKDVISPQSETTWESSSEVTSVVSGTSSAWTDGSANADRSSRRALILQMAKARMKKNNSNSTKAVEGQAGNGEDEEEKKLDSAGEEDIAINVGVSRTNSLNESGTDIDISQDLD